MGVTAPGHLPGAVDIRAGAVGVSGECSQVLERPAVGAGQECMVDTKVAIRRSARHLPGVVDALGAAVFVSRQRSQVFDCPAIWAGEISGAAISCYLS